MSRKKLSMRSARQLAPRTPGERQIIKRQFHEKVMGASGEMETVSRIVETEMKVSGDVLVVPFRQWAREHFKDTPAAAMSPKLAKIVHG